jgi:hypothetical protein
MGDYGRVPNLASRLWSSLKLAAEISQITDANYPAAQQKTELPKRPKWEMLGEYVQELLVFFWR